MPDHSDHPYQGVAHSTPSNNLLLRDIDIQRQSRSPELHPALHLDRLRRAPLAAPDPLPIPAALAQEQNDGPQLPLFHHPALNSQVDVLGLARQEIFRAFVLNVLHQHDRSREPEALARHLVRGSRVGDLVRPEDDVAGTSEAIGPGSQQARALEAVAAPGEDGLVGATGDDHLLQSAKRLLALAVPQVHVQVEDAEHAIGRVFFFGCDSVGHPAHLLRGARAAEILQMLGRYSRRFRDCGSELAARSDGFPIGVEELHFARGEHLLERPASCEPFAG